MITVGKTDSFERKYMEKFRSIASEFGEFINYEHDRGARDLGMHLTHKLASGKERLSSALIWFQMKGKMESTLPLMEYEKNKEVKISLDVVHLRYWYLQPMPTYLVLYIESADEFLVQNLSEYVKENWGRSILTLDQNTATVSVDKESKLDYQAFRIILQKNDVEEWRKALGNPDQDLDICYRDYDLIWHLGTAKERGVSHCLEFWDWQSKTRSQLFIYEKNNKNEKEKLREQWQFMGNISQLEETFPYIEFFSDEEIDDWWDEGDPEVPDIELANGDIVSGVNAAYEYFAYECGARLNEVGFEMFEWVKYLSDVGLIEVSPGESKTISIAPWHGRSV